MTDIAEKLPVEEIFRCRMCGRCCIGFGGTIVEAADIARIAGFIRADPAGFVKDYCKSSGSRRVLAQRTDGYCIFWDGTCRIHPVKPVMCRKWPFIESILADVNNWRIIAAECPGMRTDVSDDTILACVRRHLESPAGIE